MPVKNLEDGKHHIAYMLKDVFFEEHQIDEIHQLEVTVNVFFEKRQKVITAFIEIEGVGMMDCDRCLDLCSVQFENDADFIIRIGEHARNVNSLDTVYFLTDEEEFCDITDFILDEIKLGLPQKRSHLRNEDGTFQCNNDVAKLVEKYELKIDELPSDPRWEGLKNIKFN